MKITDIGEFGFINRFLSQHQQQLPTGFKGIGDDCAIIPGGFGKNFAITTDMLVENVHFVVSEIGAKLLGSKSLIVNLSDLAAVGAKPMGAFLSLALPQDVDVEFWDEFMNGFYEISRKYNCPLLGGDTTKSNSAIVINVAVIGESGKRLIGRDGAKSGDTICVTGNLGNSAAGLHFVLNKDLERDSIASKLIECHHNPIPRIEEGKFLASSKYVHSMMDISDGLSSDICHILERSKVSAIIDIDKLPYSELLKSKFGSNPFEMRKFALQGGEDYELLLTVDSKYFADLNQEFNKKFGSPLYPVGKIVEGSLGNVQYIENGFSLNSFSPTGWNHFGNC